MKSSKRFVALLLCAAMLLTSVSAAASSMFAPSKQRQVPAKDPMPAAPAATPAPAAEPAPAPAPAESAPEGQKDAAKPSSGAKCRHANVTEEYGYEHATYKIIDEQYHKVHGDHYCYLICEDCGETVKRTLLERDVTDKERHRYRRGSVVCRDCHFDPTAVAEQEADGEIEVESADSRYAPMFVVNPKKEPEKPADQPAEPENPGDPATDPEKPGDPATDSEKPGDPATDPEKPGDPTTDPEKPGDPTTDPEKPGDPTTDPEKPGDPTTDPEKPGDPTTDPEKPADQPTDPEKPDHKQPYPEKPGRPVKPVPVPPETPATIPLPAPVVPVPPVYYAVPTPKPTKAPVKLRWRTVEANWMHRIFLDDDLTLLETLNKLGESCDTLNAYGAGMAISNINHFLNASQRIAFRRMDCAEQLYLAAAAAGHAEALKGAEVTEECAGLLDELAENARRKASLRERYFPEKIQRIDGYRCRTFTIEIILNDGERTHERYTFGAMGDDWYLVKMQIGEYR